MSTLRWLMEATSGFRGALALSALHRVLGLVTAVGMMCAAVVAVVDRDWRLVMVVVGLGLCKALFSYGEQFFGHWVAFKVLEQLRARSFAALLSALRRSAPSDADQPTSGDLVERLTKDIDRIEVFYAHTLVPVISATLAPFVSALAVLAATASLPAMGIALASCALVFGSAAVGLGSMFSAHAESARLRGELTHRVSDAVFGHSEIIGYHMQNQQLEQMSNVERLLLRAHERLATWAAVRTALSVAGIIGGASAMFTLGMPRADIALAVVVVLIVGAHIAAIEQLAPSLAAAWASADRVRALEIGVAGAGEGDIENRRSWESGDLLFAAAGFNADRAARIAPGQYAVITGPSGVGKTRMLRSAVLLDRAATVEISDLAVTRLGGDELRRHVHFVPQRAVTFPGTIRFNLTLGVACSDADIERALDAVELSEHVASLGLDAPMGQWSGGQTARLAIARALLMRPDVLLLDEPTAHLDRALASRVRANIRAALPTATIVEVAHDAAEVAIADSVFRFASC